MGATCGFLLSANAGGPCLPSYYTRVERRIPIPTLLTVHWRLVLQAYISCEAITLVTPFRPWHAYPCFGASSPMSVTNLTSPISSKSRVHDRDAYLNCWDRIVLRSRLLLHVSSLYSVYEILIAGQRRVLTIALLHLILSFQRRKRAWTVSTSLSHF